MARWFRSHASKLENPKVQRLSDALYRAWDSLLCVACRYGGVLPSLSDTAFLLRKSEDATSRLIESLIERQLFVRTERGVEPHDWNEWQYKSDVSTERVKRHRKRQRNVSVTPSETKTESETETESLTPTLSVTPSAGRAVLVGDDWQPSADDLATLRKSRPDLVGEVYDRRMADFRDWCRAKAVMSHDIASTWRSFMRRTDAPRETLAKRQAEVASAVVDRDSAAQWQARLRTYRCGGFWMEHEWGPRPESGRSRVPADILAAWKLTSGGGENACN